MLNEQSDEPLEGPEDCTVNDDRPVLGIVGADIFQVEPFRHLVIELEGCALPLAANCVGHIDVNLRTVERTIAFIDAVRLIGAFERLLQGRLRICLLYTSPSPR